MAYKVVITDCPWEDISIEREVLSEIGADLVRFQCKSPEEVIAAAQDADGLLVGWAPITRDVIRSLSRCRILVRYGVGYDNVDVAAATEAGIAAANNPDYCVEEVATHSLAMMLACHRQMFPLAADLRRGIWDPMATMKPMPRLSGQTLGIIGFGRMGRHLAAMARGLVSRVLVYDPLVAQTQMDVKLADLDTVLAKSDYVSIHAPLIEETRHLFNAERIARMKPGSFLINCSRGPIIDEGALVDALQKGILGGAALDVFETEPLPQDHPLRAFPNVIITPHAAWYSATADVELRAKPARKVRDYLIGKSVELLNPELRSRA